MGMDLISAGWTTTRERKTDEEAVARYIGDLSDFAILANIDRLDESGRWCVHLGDPDHAGAKFPIEEGHEDTGAVEENKQTAQEIRDALLAGAEVMTDSNIRMSNVWSIPGTTLDFTVMGGGSWGDDPFDGYTDVCMLTVALDLWPGLRTMTDVVCGGLPSADVIAAHREREA